MPENKLPLANKALCKPAPSCLSDLFSPLISLLPLPLNPATLALPCHKPSKTFPASGPLPLQFPLQAFFASRSSNGWLLGYSGLSLSIISLAGTSLTAQWEEPPSRSFPHCLNFHLCTYCFLVFSVFHLFTFSPY